MNYRTAGYVLYSEVEEDVKESFFVEGRMFKWKHGIYGTEGIATVEEVLLFGTGTYVFVSCPSYSRHEFPIAPYDFVEIVPIINKCSSYNIDGTLL